MKKIPLTKGEFASVDDEDYVYLIQNKWCEDGGYAHRKIGSIKIYMHRFIMGTLSKKIKIDHKDGNGLNNQKYNLRLCNHQENIRNQKIRSDNTSGFKGVTWSKDKNKWRSTIVVDRKQKFLGYFTEKEKAAQIYKNASIIYFGEFSRLNTI